MASLASSLAKATAARTNARRAVARAAEASAPCAATVPSKRRAGCAAKRERPLASSTAVRPESVH